jgi:sugar lactone lactonase YvrE
MATQVLSDQITAINPSTGDHWVLAGPTVGVRSPDDAVYLHDGSLLITEPGADVVASLSPRGEWSVVGDDLPKANGIATDPTGRRVFVDEFRRGGRLLELYPWDARPPRALLEDLNGPNALAVGPDDRVYFPLVYSDEVWSYDLAEGAAAVVARDLSRPTAVKLDADGRLLVAESGSGRVTRLDIATGARAVVAQLEPGLDNVSMGTQGEIFVSRFDNGRIVDVAGAAERVLSPGGLVGPYGIEPQDDGSLLVADGLSLVVVAPDGRIEKRAWAVIELAGLFCAAARVGEARFLITAPGQGLVEWSPHGPRIVAGTDVVAEPSGLVADPAARGRFIVCDTASGQVWSIGLDGAHTSEVRGLTEPVGVARDRAGRLWVTQRRGAAVVRIGSDGSQLEITRGVDRAEGVAAAGDTVLVADVGSRRIVAIDAETGNAATVISHAPVGRPDGAPRHAFAPVAADAEGRFIVGCDGDGSIIRLAR